MKILYFLIICVSLQGCGECGFLAMRPTHTYVFRGRIFPNEHSICILFNRSILTRNGNIDRYVLDNSSFYTDSNGVFIANYFREMDCEKDGGSIDDISSPLEIYINHPGYSLFHDTLTLEKMDTLRKIAFDSVGIEQKDRYHGVWVLPDVTLIPKDTTAQ